MTEYQKPLPLPTQDTREYWEGCRRHELLIQRCRKCGIFRFYPDPCALTVIPWIRNGSSPEGKAGCIPGPWPFGSFTLPLKSPMLLPLWSWKRETDYD